MGGLGAPGHACHAGWSPLDLILLHGGHGGGSSPLGAWMGEDWAIILSSLLHTVGALAWALSAGMYLAWQRHLWEGHVSPPSLRFARRSAMAAMALNFGGGTLRIFEPGHPSIEEIGAEPWVQLIFTKHVILLGAVGITGWLFLHAGPRLQQAAREGRHLPRLERTSLWLAWILLACIAVAASLGASAVPNLPDMEAAAHA